MAEWQGEVANRIKGIHAANGALAKGGVQGLMPGDVNAIEGQIGRELQGLRRFASEISSGALPLDGRVLRRIDHYAKAGRKTFHLILRRQMQELGYVWEKSVRTAEERSCGGCRQEELRGWVPIGALVPIGERTCHRNCLCQLYFRNNDGQESGPF